MKKIVLSVAVAAIASATHASYLYWQLTGDEASAESVTFTHATVWATQGEFGSPSDTEGVALQTQQYDLNNDEFVDVATPSPVSSTDTYIVDVSRYSDSAEGWSFYIELKNYDSASGLYSTVGYLRESVDENATYAKMVDNHYIDTGLSLTPAAVWHGGSYSAVPEPSSALFMVFGLALLSLKRRKA